jgi:hypothetical protein
MPHVRLTLAELSKLGRSLIRGTRPAPVVLTLADALNARSIQHEHGIVDAIAEAAIAAGGRHRSPGPDGAGAAAAAWSSDVDDA